MKISWFLSFIFCTRSRSKTQDIGHQIIEMLNADRTLRIEMAAALQFMTLYNFMRVSWGSMQILV